MYLSTSLCNELSITEGDFLESSDEESISSQKSTEMKTPKCNFDVKEKIRQLMESTSPSPSSFLSKHKKTTPPSNASKKRKRDFNNGVGHGIKRPRFKKAKEKRHNKAKQAAMRMKHAKGTPRLPTNRSPVKYQRKAKTHKLYSPGLSLLDEVNEDNSPTGGFKFFTSRSRAAATIKINNNIRLSAMNGEITMQDRENVFEKKNVGKRIEDELERKIAAATLMSPATHVTRLENANQLGSVSLRSSPPKPTRFPSPSNKERRITKSPMRTPTRTSTRKKLWKNLNSSTPSKSPDRLQGSTVTARRLNKNSPRTPNSPRSRQIGNGVTQESPRSRRSTVEVNEDSNLTPRSKSLRAARATNSGSPLANGKLPSTPPSSRPLHSTREAKGKSPVTPRSSKVLHAIKEMNGSSPSSPRRSSKLFQKTNGHPKENLARSLVTSSPFNGTEAQKQDETDFEDLENMFEKIEALSDEDEILTSLLIENQTPEKNLNSPRRSSRKLVTSPTKPQIQTKDETPKGSPKKTENVKYFPIFEPKFRHRISNSTLAPVSCKNNQQSKRIFASKRDPSQMVIDAGQKNYGATFCKACGTLYEVGDPEDEQNHLKFHQMRLTALKYSGWKGEKQVTNIDHLGGKVIHIGPQAKTIHWQKVRDVLEYVDKELGFSENGIHSVANTNVYLYVLEKQIVGLLIVENIEHAYKVIQQETPTTPASKWAEGADASKLICCSDIPQKCPFGISRIWVLDSHRKKGIASILVNTMRANIVSCCYLTIEQFAFSDPTQAGMQFAESYTKNPNFLVYRRE